MAKRSTTSYRDYVKKYRKMEERLNKKGLVPESQMMNKKLYQEVKREMKADGVTTNINRTIVQEQSYQYSYKTARRWRETAKKYDLDWESAKISELRSGAIDVSKLNEILKDEGFTGKERAGIIGHDIFGSE